MSNNLPAGSEKLSLREWLEQYLPFQIPHIPLVQVAKNLDIALARIVGASGSNMAARIDRNTAIVAAKSSAETNALTAVSEIAAQQIKQNSPLATRALDYAFRDSILAQKNREDITAKAADELKENPPRVDAEHEIDPDWLNQFASFAEKVSSKDLQSLWAKILAGEVRNPGSVRIRTLQQLSVISRDEAELVHAVLSYVIADFIYKDGIQKDFADLRELIVCEQLDLLSGTEGMLSITVELKAGNETRYRSHNKGIRIVPQKDYTLNIPVYPLTSFAEDLLRIANNISAKSEYLEQFAKFVKSKTGANVFIAEIALHDPERQLYSTISEKEI